MWCSPWRGSRPWGTVWPTLRWWRRRGAAGCRILMILAAGVLLGGALAGCTAVARHQVLTFFFTGVPPLGTVAKPEPTAKAPLPPPRARARVVKATRFGHGPYAANLCFACHQVSASGGFRGFGKQDEAKDAIAGAGQISGQLLAPVGELCSSCHRSRSPARAQAAGLWVHGPVATGYCVMCHAPHSAPQLYQLQKESNRLCAECHDEATVFNRAVHQGRQDCVSCHNAHIGKDSRMLKADYREAW